MYADAMASASISRHVARDGRIRFRVQGRLDGERVAIGLYDDEERALDEKLAWLAVHQGDSSSLTVGSWGEQWLKLRETGGMVRSALDDRRRWNKYIAKDPVARVVLRSLSRRHVVEWRDRLLRLPSRRGGRLAAQTVRNAWYLLSGCLLDAIEREHIDASPMASMKVPEVIETERSLRFLSAKQIGKLLERELAPHQRSIFTVAIYAGLRAGELCGLRWCDVALAGEHPELHVCRSRGGPPKGNRSRRVPLLGPAVEALKAWRREQPGVGEALVWPSDGRGSKKGKELPGGCHARGYDAGWALLGYDETFHDLRHTCASHLVMGTWTDRPLELIEVRDWLGHASIKTTERYAHLRPGRLHEVAHRRHTEPSKTRGKNAK